MNAVTLNIIRFIVLFFLQIVIFNNIDLLGYLNPYPYILFILLFPINGNKNLLLLVSFLMGLFLDIFCNSGGIHAFASTVLAFIRPNLFRFSFGVSYEYQTIKINDKLSSERFSFLLLTILIHHFVLFALEFFRPSLILTVLGRTLATTAFTLVVSIIIIYLIKPNKR